MVQEQAYINENLRDELQGGTDDPGKFSLRHLNIQKWWWLLLSLLLHGLGELQVHH